MSRLILAAAFSLATALPVTGFAQTGDTYENRLALAEIYVAQSLEVIDMEAMIQTMYGPLLDQFRSQGMTITDGQIAEIHALYMQVMSQPMLDIMNGQDEIMAQLFTLEEITALNAFYNTPVGRSVMTKLPQLAEAIQPQIMTLVQTNVPQIIPELQRILGQ